MQQLCHRLGLSTNVQPSRQDIWLPESSDRRFDGSISMVEQQPLNPRALYPYTWQAQDANILYSNQSNIKNTSIIIMKGSATAAPIH